MDQVQENICRIYDVIEEEDQFLVIMEFCDGGSLLDYLYALSIEDLHKKFFDIALDIVNAVAFLHEKNIIHRDLKPENIYLAKRRVSDQIVDIRQAEKYICKVGDFGLSKNFENKVLITSILGTINYMAKEILEGKYNEKIDIWSLGCIFYELKTKKQYFQSENLNLKDIFSQIKKFKKYDVIGNDIDFLISQCLNINSSERITASKLQKMIKDMKEQKEDKEIYEIIKSVNDIDQTAHYYKQMLSSIRVSLHVTEDFFKNNNLTQSQDGFEYIYRESQVQNQDFNEVKQNQDVNEVEQNQLIENEVITNYDSEEGTEGYQYSIPPQNKQNMEKNTLLFPEQNQDIIKEQSKISQKDNNSNKCQESQLRKEIKPEENEDERSQIGNSKLKTFPSCSGTRLKYGQETMCYEYNNYESIIASSTLSTLDNINFNSNLIDEEKEMQLSQQMQLSNLRRMLNNQIHSQAALDQNEESMKKRWMQLNLAILNLIAKEKPYQQINSLIQEQKEQVNLIIQIYFFLVKANKIIKNDKSIDSYFKQESKLSQNQNERSGIVQISSEYSKGFVYIRIENSKFLSSLEVKLQQISQSTKINGYNVDVEDRLNSNSPQSINDCDYESQINPYIKSNNSKDLNLGIGEVFSRYRKFTCNSLKKQRLSMYTKKNTEITDDLVKYNIFIQILINQIYSMNKLDEFLIYLSYCTIIKDINENDIKKSERIYFQQKSSFTETNYPYACILFATMLFKYLKSFRTDSIPITRVQEQPTSPKHYQIIDDLLFLLKDYLYKPQYQEDLFRFVTDFVRLEKNSENQFTLFDQFIYDISESNQKIIIDDKKPFKSVYFCIQDQKGYILVSKKQSDCFLNQEYRKESSKLISDCAIQQKKTNIS